MLTMSMSIFISFILPIIVMLIATILSKKFLIEKKDLHLKLDLIQKDHHE